MGASKTTQQSKSQHVIEPGIHTCDVIFNLLLTDIQNFHFFFQRSLPFVKVFCFYFSFVVFIIIIIIIIFCFSLLGVALI